MKLPPRRSDADKLVIAQQVFNAVFDHCATFREGNIGSDLAYLMGAIVQDEPEDAMVDWSGEVIGGTPALLYIMTEHFPPGHPVWEHVKL